MANILIGAIMMAGFLFVVTSARKKSLPITWWQWIITILGFIYATFVLEIIVSFLAEGAGRAALVIGTILGLIAVIWGVMLGRFIFTRRAR